MRFIFSYWLVSGLNWKIQLKHYSFRVFHSLEVAGGILSMIMWHRSQVIGPFQNLSVQRVKSSLWWLKLRDTDFLVLPLSSERRPFVNNLLDGWILQSYHCIWVWAAGGTDAGPSPGLQLSKGEDTEGHSDSFYFRDVASLPHRTRQQGRQEWGALAEDHWLAPACQALHLHHI